MLALALFALELAIALWVRDAFVRPYVGDVLVVILLYACVQAFFRVAYFPLSLAVCVFAFGIEGLQYLGLVEKLGWQEYAIARTVLGTSFAWADLLAYSVGAVLIVVIEFYRDKMHPRYA
ncbi:DUF2809 domain-containing protein [Cytophagales bacterium LB-30]|uniref:DUF2809 domain-containing protein n=1 Tax=Shiella aurantiaca TaxID=3058365 RepID=A0ABT8F0I0_9BACT|nr:DUF2809 domain-containing protein [Shiella aurantiaca]MDN4163950.1 DUF2809 domain-containing protein [Shiella aurantiaca]